jgi:hypothetical protein
VAALADSVPAPCLMNSARFGGLFLAVLLPIRFPTAVLGDAITRYLSPLRGETFLCAGTHGEPMTNKSMVRINQDRGSNDPALPKPNPVSPTPVPATESDPELDTTEDPPDSPQVQPKRP